MKLNIQIIIIFLFVLIFSACDKTPSASFKTDKTEYVAGETVKLTNTSDKGYSYKWTMPDGQQITTNDANYLIPADFGFGRLDFKLEAFSKHKRKMNSKTTSVEAVPQSYIIKIDANQNTTKFNHVNKLISAYYNFIRIGVNNDNSVTQPACFYEDVWIYFQGNQLPNVGTFNLKQNYVGLQSNEACLQFLTGPCELPSTLISNTGQMIVDYANGKLHITFNNVDSQNASIKMSGEIFLPSNL